MVCPKSPTTTAASTNGTCGSYWAARHPKASPKPSPVSSHSPACQYSTCPRRRPTMSACISRFDGRLDPDLVRRLVELTQSGLPLVDNPWAWIGERLDLDEDTVLALLRQLQDDGAIRRIAAVPNHYRLGYRHNGMTVWEVDDRSEERRVGKEW